MRVVFVMQVILLLCGISNCHIGQKCASDEHCLSFEACDDGKCVLCHKRYASCTFMSSWGCCKGNTCEEIPGLLNEYGSQQSMCVPNNNRCKTNADCGGGLRCLARLGKCGLCHNNGESCSLPYDKYECCSSYCAIHLNDTVCADPSLVGTITPPKPEPKPEPERYTFNNNHGTNGSSRQSCQLSSDCPSGEKCTLTASASGMHYYFICTKCLNSPAICPGPYPSFKDCCHGQSCQLASDSPTGYRCKAF